MTELENRAHAQKALISSDAMRFFMNATPAKERIERFNTIIADAHASFSGPDGWVVINLPRIEALSDDTVDTDGTFTDQAITAGSLAEAIMTGNVVAAYAMIANRPMIALADATADLDAAYRARKGEEVQISALLKQEAHKRTDEQLMAAIAALTSALDGTYTSESDAVRTAIMKAITATA